MRSSSGRIDIAACARKLHVDNRISIRTYYRIADNLLRQAKIFREEENVIDLYVMLLRFSSLINETIPRHQDYGISSQSKKDTLRKQLLNALNELERLRPAVKLKIEELDRRYTNQVNGSCHRASSDPFNSFVEWPIIKKAPSVNYQSVEGSWHLAQGVPFENSKTRQSFTERPVEERFYKLSLSIPRPKTETLSRHSILGPNGLHGQWQPPASTPGVSYPSNIKVTPIDIPRLDHAVEDLATAKNDDRNLEGNHFREEPILPETDPSQRPQSNELGSLISFETPEMTPVTVIVKQPSPPPILAQVHDLIPAVTPSVGEVQEMMSNTLSNGLVSPESPMELHISTTMMDTFMKLARSNTVKSLETCGVLAGSLKNRKFRVTALIIPKQESTANSCQTTNEEEIFEVQDKQSLFPLGWIHTHPTQSCFMSSIDLHTHYSYQIMLPEAVAIVMAPQDRSKNHGIFRLTAPGGMSVIRNCPQRGFHPHEQPADGSPIYSSCTDVYMNPNLKFDVIDLRS